MPSRDEIKQIYIDTNLIHEWFARLMRNENKEDPDFILFLRQHQEIKKFISIFTISEIVESLLFNEKKIKDHMKKMEIIGPFIETFVQTTGVSIIEEVHLSSKLIDYTSICGTKDSIHLCIAEHENLWLITHDDRFGKVKHLYQNIMTDRHLFKLFKE